MRSLDLAKPESLGRRSHWKGTIRIACIPVLLLLCCTMALAADLEWRGQVSGWTGGNRSGDKTEAQVGLRYIPRAKLTLPLDTERFVDVEVALHALATLTEGLRSTDLEPYRLTCRFATAQTETTFGLQKLNFGPARLLRPLRWFDRLDPRDPLRFTEGAVGARFRYNALDNSGVWLWALLGNDAPKGYERVGSDPWFPEIGGRVQRPVGPGELAVTLHTRQVASKASSDEPEIRLGVDGRWDLGVGVWFEGFAQRLWRDQMQDDLLGMMTLGTDYTFDLGNGLYLLAEQMLISTNEGVNGEASIGHVSGLLASYPLGLFDAAQFILYQTWKPRASMGFVQWQRNYDRLTLSLSLYRTSVPGSIPGKIGLGSLTSGTGGQFQVILYH